MFIVGELPDMMSASEGCYGKGGCVHFPHLNKTGFLWVCPHIPTRLRFYAVTIAGFASYSVASDSVAWPRAPRGPRAPWRPRRPREAAGAAREVGGKIQPFKKRATPLVVG